MSIALDTEETADLTRIAGYVIAAVAVVAGVITAATILTFDYLLGRHLAANPLPGSRKQLPQKGAPTI